MSDDPQPSAVLEALEQAVRDLYSEYDGLRLFAIYTYRTPGGDLQSGEFMTHIGEDVVTGGAQALLEEFEKELVEQALLQWEESEGGGDVFTPSVADIVAPIVHLTRYKTMLSVEALDPRALAPLSEGTLVCTAIDDAGNPIEGKQVGIEFEGGGRIVSDRMVATDARGQAQFVYEAASTPGDVVFRVRAAGLVVTMEGHVGVPSYIDHDAPDRVEPNSATRITYSVFDDEGFPIGGREVSTDLLAGVGQIVEEVPYHDGQGGFTYLAQEAPSGAVFEIRVGALRQRIDVAVDSWLLLGPNGTASIHMESAPCLTSTGADGIACAVFRRRAARLSMGSLGL